ncbi:hypothetical protein BDZ91DRAFT_791448 [Kalaharituber pfeilii]|nr:hypothetical protein BDZ91DRAFT_791448 [Kalaharituber pfeilii]
MFNSFIQTGVVFIAFPAFDMLPTGTNAFPTQRGLAKILGEYPYQYPLFPAREKQFQGPVNPKDNVVPSLQGQLNEMINSPFQGGNVLNQRWKPENPFHVVNPKCRIIDTAEYARNDTLKRSHDANATLPEYGLNPNEIRLPTRPHDIQNFDDILHFLYRRTVSNLEAAAKMLFGNTPFSKKTLDPRSAVLEESDFNFVNPSHEGNSALDVDDLSINLLGTNIVNASAEESTFYSPQTEDNHGNPILAVLANCVDVENQIAWLGYVALFFFVLGSIFASLSPTRFLRKQDSYVTFITQIA